ncbi:MAG: riboflavin synthase [Acidimicrobiia bacterium]
MFTGIVTELGAVQEVQHRDGIVALTVGATDTVRGLAVGDSVAVNGVCLTAVAVSEDQFEVEMVDETMQRSSLGALATGTVVNLERPLAASGRFDGHVVQGHVDGVGTIASIDAQGGSSLIRITMPGDLARYVVEKGSICVDGVSLTVAGVSKPTEDAPWFEVAVIPHTLDVTVFGRRSTGDAVNLEVDVFAKYVERMIGEHQ